MAKRFVDTTIWTQNKWFRTLKPKYKLFWLYLFCNCDSVGVWEEDFELSSFIIGEEFKKEEILEIFKDKIKYFSDKKIWIIDFCNFQYGTLIEENLSNKPHQSYIGLLKKHRLWIDYTIPLQRDKEKEKEKEKEKDKEKEKESYTENKKIFDDFRQKYPGIKRGLDPEYENLCKKNKPSEICPLLLPALERQIQSRKILDDSGKFVPQWKNLTTWINQKCWTEETGSDTMDEKLPDWWHKNDCLDKLNSLNAEEINNLNAITKQKIAKGNPQILLKVPGCTKENIYEFHKISKNG